jgi:hypothetical protein
MTWAKVGTADGRSIPLDPDPTTKGNIVLTGVSLPDGTPIVRMLSAAQKDREPGMFEERFVSHFATCPESKEWRRG